MERNSSATAATFCALAVLCMTARVGAGGDKVAFPADYTKGVMF